MAALASGATPQHVAAAPDSVVRNLDASMAAAATTPALPPALAVQQPSQLAVKRASAEKEAARCAAELEKALKCADVTASEHSLIESQQMSLELSVTPHHPGHSSDNYVCRIRSYSGQCGRRSRQ